MTLSSHLECFVKVWVAGLLDCLRLLLGLLLLVREEVGLYVGVGGASLVCSCKTPRCNHMDQQLTRVVLQTKQHLSSDGVVSLLRKCAVHTTQAGHTPSTG